MFAKERLPVFVLFTIFTLLLAAYGTALAEKNESETENPLSTIQATPEITKLPTPATNPTQEPTEAPLKSVDPFTGINLRFNPNYWP